MPSGATHDRITLWILPCLVILTWFLTRNGEIVLLLLLGFLFSGLMFGPDLDIYSVQFKRWGKLRFIWLPYQKLIKHRSLLSHGLLIGNCLRVIYLFTIVTVTSMVGVGIAQLIWSFDWNWGEFRHELVTLAFGDYKAHFLALYLGLEIGAISHILSDLLVSDYKRRSKRKGQKTPREKSSKGKKSR